MNTFPLKRLCVRNPNVSPVKAAACSASEVQSFGYYRGGCYASNLRPFLELFPCERFKFILFEDFRSDFQGTMNGVFDFLGMQPRPVRQVRSNPASQPISSRLREYLRRPTGILGFLLRLASRTVSPEARFMTKRWLQNAIQRPASYPPMEAGIEAELRLRYADEVRGAGGDHGSRSQRLASSLTSSSVACRTGWRQRVA